MCHVTHVCTVQSNLLRRLDPRVNVLEDKLREARHYFTKHAAQPRSGNRGSQTGAASAQPHGAQPMEL